jgi:hypothetical protein
MATPQQAAYAQVQLDIQAELESIALQYRIRPGDLRVEWDGGTMEMVTGTHVLVISMPNVDYPVTVHLDHDALMRRDQLHYLPRLEEAIAELRDSVK